MKKQEILDNIKDFLEKDKAVTEVYPDIIEKHGVTNITSGFADKLDSINDPFERFIVAVHLIDQMDIDLVSEEDPKTMDEMVALRRHKDLLMTCLKLNRKCEFKAGGEVLFQAEIIALGDFDRYISNFEFN